MLIKQRRQQEGNTDCLSTPRFPCQPDSNTHREAGSPSISAQICTFTKFSTYPSEYPVANHRPNHYISIAKEEYPSSASFPFLPSYTTLSLSLSIPVNLRHVGFDMHVRRQAYIQPPPSRPCPSLPSLSSAPELPVHTLPLSLVPTLHPLCIPLLLGT